MTTDQARPDGGAGRPNLLLLAVAYVGFVSLGLPDALTGVAWPSVRGTFALPQSGLGLVLAAYGAGYFGSSFASGRLTAAAGIGLVLTASSGLVAAAMFGTAAAPAWAVAVGCAAAWGLGSGAIDAGLNAYVAVRFPARHVNWLHACYSLGATLGPVVMTAALVRAGTWRVGYAAVGAAMLAMTGVFLLTARRWGRTEAAGDTPAVGVRAALGHPLVGLQAAVFFVYTGLEAAVGQWAFTLLTEARGVGVGAAGGWVGGYYGAIAVGRLVLGAAADRVGPDRLVRLSVLGAVAGAALLAFGPPPWAAPAGLVLVGFGLAPVFPTVMARTPARVGPAYAAHAVGFQVSAAMVGVGVVPGTVGLLAGRVGLDAVAYAALGLAAGLWALHEFLLARAARLAASPGGPGAEGRTAAGG